MQQRTIARTVSCSGIGLHSGKEVSFRLSPAPPNTGVIFISSDGNNSLTATLDQVCSTRLSTTLGDRNFSVQTVEHLLSALCGLGIDNVLITLEGDEIPIMDGSASQFVTAIRKAGCVVLPPSRKVVRILQKIELEEGEGFIRICPSESPSISYTIRYDHPGIPEQSYHYLPSEESFRLDIAPARTYGFLHEVEALREQGLIRGGSLDNALVVGEQGILNPQGLRFSDEFVRHKILDLIGDFSLFGSPIIGKIEAHCSGHSLHIGLLQKLCLERDAWLLEEAKQDFPIELLALSS